MLVFHCTAGGANGISRFGPTTRTTQLKSNVLLKFIPVELVKALFHFR